MLPLSQRRLSRRIAAPAPIRGIGRAIQNTDHKFTVPRLTACLCTALSLAVCLPLGALAAEKAEDRNIAKTRRQKSGSLNRLYAPLHSGLLGSQPIWQLA